MTTPKPQPVTSLPYIDIQHDALTVYDEIVQNVVSKEDIWVSGYKVGSTSIHGNVTLEAKEGKAAQGVVIAPRDGVEVEQESRTSLRVAFPALDIPFTSLKFPRQIIHPPYTKSKSTTPPLHINSLAYSAQKGLLAVAGPDGYLCVLPAGLEGKGETKVFKGHVGDVLNVKFFPSGEVILSASSDLSLRIWGIDGSNPRTLKGHTRAVTCTAIIGVGKQVVSGSKDGSVRLWNVGEGKEVRKWTTEGRVAVEEVLLDSAGERVLAFKSDGVVEVFDLSGAEKGEEVGSKLEAPKEVGGLNCAAWDRQRGIIAVGHTSGIIHLREISMTEAGMEVKSEMMVRRNEASVYSLAWTTEGDLLVGTAAGLPCRLSVELGEGIKVGVKEELAGWEAVGVEAWAVVPDGGVWCAGGEGGIRRY